MIGSMREIPVFEDEVRFHDEEIQIKIKKDLEKIDEDKRKDAEEELQKTYAA